MHITVMTQVYTVIITTYPAHIPSVFVEYNKFSAFLHHLHIIHLFFMFRLFYSEKRVFLKVSAPLRNKLWYFFKYAV